MQLLNTACYKICEEIHALIFMINLVMFVVYYISENTIIYLLIIYMKKFLHFDWLRAVQFLGNTVPKKKFSAKKGNSVQISLDFKFLNFLTTHVYL